MMVTQISVSSVQQNADDHLGFSFEPSGGDGDVSWSNVWSVLKTQDHYQMTLRDGRNLSLKRNLSGLDELIRSYTTHAASRGDQKRKLAYESVAIALSDDATEILEADAKLTVAKECPACGRVDRATAPEYPPQLASHHDVVVCANCGFRYQFISLGSILLRFAIALIAGVTAVLPILYGEGGATIFLVLLMGGVSVFFLANGILRWRRSSASVSHNLSEVDRTSG